MPFLYQLHQRPFILRTYLRSLPATGVGIQKQEFTGHKSGFRALSTTNGDGAVGFKMFFWQ